MLNRVSFTAFAPCAQGSEKVTPAQLARRLKCANPVECALTSAELQTGELVYVKLPARLANRVTGANTHLAAAARHLSPSQRAAVRRGDMDLKPLPPALDPIPNGLLDKIITVVGPDRVMASLDRITRPMSVAAE